MTDSPDPADPLGFDPVPVRARRDGWTPERQRRFNSGDGGDGRHHRRRPRRRQERDVRPLLTRTPGAAGFARAWDIAQAMAGDRALEAAIDRAINGVAVPRFYRGRQVATIRRPDYRLALKVLGHHLTRPAPTIDYHAALAAIGADEAGDR